jgi:hypothetical protein
MDHRIASLEEDLTTRALAIRVALASVPSKNSRKCALNRRCALHRVRHRPEDYCINIRHLADLEDHKSLKEAHLRCLDASVQESLKMLKRCTNLCRITLETEIKSLPPPEKLCDFIMALKHLTFLHINCHFGSHCNHFKSEVDKVKAFVSQLSPCRPNFQFLISCCPKFGESRVPNEFFFILSNLQFHGHRNKSTSRHCCVGTTRLPG